MFYPISGYFTANGAIASDAGTGEYGYRSSIGSCNLRDRVHHTIFQELLRVCSNRAC